MIQTQQTIEGYKRNASGYLVPLSKISELELMRDELVSDMIQKAMLLQDTMKSFKRGINDDITAFMALSAERFDVQLGGEKGNVSLLSFDGQYKVLLAIQQNIAFDENIHAAKALIDNCLHRWTQNSDDNIKALIEHAFRVDSQGNIRTAAVLNLFKLKITDSEWLKAMEALKESITPTGSKSYIRFYQRVGDEGKFEQISLDIAGL